MVRHFGYANVAPASAEGDGLMWQNPEFLWSILLNQVDELDEPFYLVSRASMRKEGDLRPR